MARTKQTKRKSDNKKPTEKKKKKPSLSKLVKKNEELKMMENGRVHCSITGMDLMPVYDTVKAHLTSKAYQKAGMYMYNGVKCVIKCVKCPIDSFVHDLDLLCLSAI